MPVPPLRSTGYPSTTLIRLYELLKNDSRSSDSTRAEGKTHADALLNLERDELVEDERDRTDDPLLAKQVLSQLS